MDPRRFTPNLHASLVSEILSLRREIESKNSTLETLEESLHSSRVDNGQLEATVASQEREIRSVKKQMQLLESGTLSALGDLARERDDAVANLADVYKRLEVSKSDSRNHEEAARRDQAMWEQDKHNWDRERRNMERKVHVAEGRLKTMVHEVAAVQANTQLASTAGSDNEEGVGEPWFSNWSDIISTRSSSVRGRYHLSELSNNTYDTNELANLRNSVVPARLSMSGTEPNNLNLADELNFEEAADEHDLRHALLEEDVYKPRRPSVQSPDHKARKLLGLAIDSTEQTVDRAPLTERGSATLLPLQTDKRMTSTAQDAGMQFSPPMPPKPAVHEVEVVPEKDAYRNANTENTANQRRKRVSVAAASQESFPPQLEPLSRPSTASIACQTVLQPTSPRLVPMIALEPIFPEPSTISRPEMVSSSAQTDDEKQTASEVTGTMKLFPSIAVPVIAIHPPNSRPGTAYNDAMLPPRTQNASCQTETPTLASSNSVAVQTDGIWVDKRPLKIPPRRISAAASTKPHAQHGQHAGLPSSKGRRSELQSPPPVESLGPRARPSITQTKDSHMTKLRDQLRNRGQTSNPTSPTKSNNPFSGLSNQEGSEKEIDFSDDDDFASVAPIRKTLSKVQNSWKLVPAPTSASLGSRATGRPISDIQEVDDTVDTGLSGIQAGAAKDSVAPSACQLGPDEKVDISMKAPQLSDVRKAALISSRALAHSRKRSSSETGPSAASTTVPPPFPVPTRSSSRKIRISSSEGNRSPTPYSTSFIAGIRNRGKGPPASKNPLRKVRSAAAVPKVARSNIKQDEADSPTVTSPASTPLGSPGLPRILRSESSPQQSSALSRELEQAASSSGFAAPEPATESPGQTTSVIDAIAQTMVGEWMWKYVRKRKSFGIAETARAEFDEGRSNGESSSGIRHKRWVWLAPYERVVLWSSKQPTNGTALLGKGGRKRKALWILRKTKANAVNSHHSVSA